MCDISKETFDMMKLQHELGRVRSVGVQNAEASYLSVVAQTNDLHRQIRATENTLSLLIGQAGQQIPRTTLEAQSLPEQFSVGVGIQLLNNRPDVHAAEMQLAQCFHGKQNARAQFLPGINITASGGWSNLQGNVDPGHWLWQLGASLTQPIFANGKLIAGLKVAKAQYEIAFNNWQRAILSAGNEVSNALVNYNGYDANSRIEAERIQVLTKNVEDTRALYQSSGSSYLEVLTAQQQLLSAQLNKASNDFSKMQSVGSLYTALGGGGK
jgi:outer membrane protein TolC